jgi:hypothetical protein
MKPAWPPLGVSSRDVARPELGRLTARKPARIPSRESTLTSRHRALPHPRRAAGPGTCPVHLGFTRGDISCDRCDLLVSLPDLHLNEGEQRRSVLMINVESPPLLVGVRCVELNAGSHGRRGVSLVYAPDRRSSNGVRC